jgi:hypothetical protein
LGSLGQTVKKAFFGVNSESQLLSCPGKTTFESISTFQTGPEQQYSMHQDGEDSLLDYNFTIYKDCELTTSFQKHFNQFCWGNRNCTFDSKLLKIKPPCNRKGTD